MPLEFSSVPLSDLALGAVLTAPIFDPNTSGTKLLGASLEINELFLKQLAARGINSVSVSRRDLAAMHAGTPQGSVQKVRDHVYATASKETDLSRSIDSDINAEDFRSQASALESTKTVRQDDSRSDQYDHAAMSAEVKQRERQVEYMDGLFVNLVEGSAADTDSLTDVCRSSIQSVINDKDMFLCLGLNPFNADYPARHSLHVCSVAISIGVTLGLDDKSLVDLGTGCLIHDVGMLKIDPRLYKSKRRLIEPEMVKLAAHPIHTLDALACPGVRISRVARIVAYQIHERCDGSGYPRGRKAEEIHVLAKIAAVADAYVGLVSNRSYRRGMLPYYAMEKILNGVSLQLFDPKAVRGLLKAISLFPIGSFVETTHGQIGRVVRTTGETYTQPIIQLWDDHHKQFAPDLINLTEESSIQIAKASQQPQVE